MEVFNPNSNINFLGLRRISIAVSAVLVVIALAAIFVKGLNYGLDFTGGVLVEAEYTEAVEVSDVRAALAEANFGDAQVVSSGAHDVAIRLQNRDVKADANQGAAEVKTKNDQLAAEVLKALQVKRSDARIKHTDFVSATVGDELKSDGIIAVLFVIIGIMIYIGIRF